VYENQLDLPLIHAGKVRELYAMDGDRLLMVATDNISAFDYVLRSQIPDKGKILTQLSLWWFDRMGDIVDNHVLSTEVPAVVAGRAVVCQRLKMLPIECVARGYLTGSGWLEYQQSGTVCGIALPSGLLDGSQLPEPIFTPATKAEVGEHDENISFALVAEKIGTELAATVRDMTLAVYDRAQGIARDRGIILADTKLEFGQRGDGTTVLADELLTPDSSRFWDAASWQPGGRLVSYDKQYVRNWLLHDSGWERNAAHPSEPPALPPEVVAATRSKYEEAVFRLTGTPFATEGPATPNR
jgi:phosphoribosylaminoimidazole-succinocarboxamide synthase